MSIKYGHYGKYYEWEKDGKIKRVSLGFCKAFNPSEDDMSKLIKNKKNN